MQGKRFDNDPREKIHEQGSPSAQWVIHHDLGAYPEVTVIDSTGELVIGDVVYTTVATIVTLNFGAPFSGKAILRV